MSLPLRWHDAVPADLRSVRATFGQAAFDEARRIIAALPGDPLLGDWLTDHPVSGDLSACRKVGFGPDEITSDGANLGPAVRLVYRLLPSNTEVEQVEVLCVAPRRDLVAYAVAAARLQES